MGFKKFLGGIGKLITDIFDPQSISNVYQANADLFSNVEIQKYYLDVQAKLLSVCLTLACISGIIFFTGYILNNLNKFIYIFIKRSY
ncbi:hypothetical protein DH96_02525 [Candidatus Phytoplasma oryzae]|uniref:Uncharacterized protein n=1 Tax=Candidatus Phytoplasma oryzae TaxID=203274 RepID=A0A328IHZ4_9MOLU|nr:hypothetical protein [Candidatus Phytoplasma oryzae]RAM55445.1 hypothetical protein DH96_02525 [Candidatus Phytoplasma oryzae]